MFDSDLPPVKVNTARTRTEDRPVSMVPGYQGHVPRSREQFGRTYAAVTEQLPHGSRRSLFKITKQLAPPLRVELPDEHPQAVLQKTSWNDPTDYDPSRTMKPTQLVEDKNMYETTNFKMMTKRNTFGTPNESIRMVPGYQGFIPTYRESFGGTFGSITAPLSARPAPATTETLLARRSRDLPMRESKGLQIHTPFTMPLTPRDQASIKVFLENTRARTRSAGDTIRAGNALIPALDLARVNHDGSLKPAVAADQPTMLTMSTARSPKPPSQPVRPKYDRSAPRPQLGSTNPTRKPDPAITLQKRDRTARSDIIPSGQSDTGDVFNAVKFVKPRDTKVINNMFNAGRGGYMGQEAEAAASSYHLKHRPFGSQFGQYNPSKTTPWGQRFDQL